MILLRCLILWLSEYFPNQYNISCTFDSSTPPVFEQSFKKGKRSNGNTNNFYSVVSIQWDMYFVMKDSLVVSKREHPNAISCNNRVWTSSFISTTFSARKSLAEAEFSKSVSRLWDLLWVPLLLRESYQSLIKCHQWIDSRVIVDSIWDIHQSIGLV